MELGIDRFALPVALVGGLLILDLLLQAVLHRTAIPSVVVHLALGVLLALEEARWGWLEARGREVIHFLGSVGVVFLLFRVGLESNLRALLENLRGASFVWLSSVSVAGCAGFLAGRYGIGLDRVPSLFLAVAMTVTSVGVSVAVWREEGAHASRDGQLLLDVAELDDLSGIVGMTVLFSIAPLLHEGRTEQLVGSVGWTVLQVLARLMVFALGVALFAGFLEAPLTRLLSRIEPVPDRMITVVSVGLLVAAGAGVLGFSFAIGAFFAGLAFSRDAEAVRLDASFDPLFDFFTPFFFIAVGLQIEPGAIGAAIPLGAGLFLVLVAAKLLGAGGGSLLLVEPRSAVLLGLSMIPCAEISMVVLEQGRQLGAWALPEEVFAAMVLVSLLTCLTAPLAIRSRLRRLHPGPEGE